VKITARSLDVEEAREIHALAFAADDWVGDDHTFWAYYSGKPPRVVGFCSAILHSPSPMEAFLSRSAVAFRVRGRGLQRRMIRDRVRWIAEHQPHARIVTYTLLDNYASITNLILCGFRFYVPKRKWAHAGPSSVHYFKLGL
jgi:hypothetical protein